MKTKKLFQLIVLPLLVLISLFPGCNLEKKSDEIDKLSSDKPRNQNPDVPLTDVQTLVTGNNQFAFELMNKFCQKLDKNVIFSPYSISIAFSMVHAGARNETANQIASTFHFSLPLNQHHQAWNALDLKIINNSKNPDKSKENYYQFNCPNAVWVQKDFFILSQFLDVLAENYGADMKLLDFIANPLESRNIINNWVSQETHNKIKNLLNESDITTLTRLVLTNAIYLKADWLSQFDPELTTQETFFNLDGSTSLVDMMTQEIGFFYSQTGDCQTVVIPYMGERLKMAIMKPNPETFKPFAASLDYSRFKNILDNMQPTAVKLYMPKFEYEYTASDLIKDLSSLGLIDAFDPILADFSGIDNARDLYIFKVAHKAFINVNEKGTEAAAATAIVLNFTSIPTPEVNMRLDHPFIYVIYENETGAILFIGAITSL